VSHLRNGMILKPGLETLNKIIKVFKLENINDILEKQWGYEMIDRVCLKWCIKKWEWIVRFWNYCINKDENYDNLVKAIPQLEKFLALCALCEKYDAGFNILYSCEYKCPLGKINEYCRWENSIYHKWAKSTHRKCLIL
jgi:hypothetical protein